MKSNMQGATEEYRHMYEALNEFDKYLFSIGWGLDDAPYHGWHGDPLKNECEIYKNISQKYEELKIVLEEALDITGK